MHWIHWFYAGKKWTNITSLFSPDYFEKNDSIFRNISKMKEGNSTDKIDRITLTNPTKFRLNEISKIENYFNQEIKKKVKQ